MNKEQQDEIKRLGLIEIIPCEVEEKRDEKGRIIWQKFNDGTTEERRYDDNGKMIWYKYPDGTTDEWKYDEKGNLIWRKYPNGNIEEWKYDNKGRVIWHKDDREIYYIDDKRYRKAESLDKEELK